MTIGHFRNAAAGSKRRDSRSTATQCKSAGKTIFLLTRFRQNKVTIFVSQRGTASAGCDAIEDRAILHREGEVPITGRSQLARYEETITGWIWRTADKCLGKAAIGGLVAIQ